MALCSIALHQRSPEAFVLSRDGLGGTVICGQNKIAQDFAIELLTQEGSNLMRPDIGTNIPALLSKYNVLSIDTISMDMQRESDRVIAKRRFRYPDAVLADTIDSALIVSAAEEQDRVSFLFALRFADGKVVRPTINIKYNQFADV